jgi:hypothetical protein
MTRKDETVTEPSRYARKASAIVRAAREAVGTAGMDREEFAAYLGAELDEVVPPEEFEFWEIGGSMPGDVMLLCAVVIREAMAAGVPVSADIRSSAEQTARGLPRLPAGDPVRELLNRWAGTE